MKRIGIGLAMGAALAMAGQAAHAQYDQRISVVRSFEQKDGSTGAQISGNIRGVDVNTNVGSPYYGYVYFCDLTGMTAGNPKSHILIYKPAADQTGTSSTHYVDTGLRIEVDTSTSNFASVQGGHGVSVGPDDSVWIADFSERAIKVAPPVPPGADTTVTAATVVNLPADDVAALASLPDGWTVGNPRNVHVARTHTDAGDVDVLLVANNTGDSSQTDQTIQKYTITKSGGVYTAAYSWTRPIADLDNDPLVNDAQGNAGYDVTCDDAGNVYIPLRAASGEVAIRKLDPNGNTAAFANTPTAPFRWSGDNESGEQNVSVDAGFPGIAYVKDATVPGGGYLYWIGRVGNGGHGGLFDLTGNLMLGIGTNFRYNPLSGNILGYIEADDIGNLYTRYGNTSSNANFAKGVNAQPFVSSAAAVEGLISSPATSANGVTYFGGSDGKLYAIDDATGLAPAGTAFPVSVADSGDMILGRIAIRDTGNGPFLYFTTSMGAIGRLPISGDTSELSGTWLTTPLAPASNVAVTPAVTNDGLLYVAIGDGASASLFRLDANTGGSVMSQTLPATQALSSPSVVSNNIYVGTDAGTFRILDTGGSFVVSAGSSVATSGSPFVHLTGPNGAAVYVANNDGVVQARNATNFNAISAFGGDGDVALGANVQSSLFAVNNILYVGASDNKVYALNEGDGSGAGPGGSTVFFDAGEGGAIPGGVAVSPGGTAVSEKDPGGLSVIFGSTNGRFYQVRAADPAAYRAYAAALPVFAPAAGTYPDPVVPVSAPSVDRTMAGPNGTTIVNFISDVDGRTYRIPGL